MFLTNYLYFSSNYSYDNFFPVASLETPVPKFDINWLFPPPINKAINKAINMTFLKQA